MKKLFLGALVVILVVGLILGGCPKPEQTTTPTPTLTPTPTAPYKVLKIGSILGLNMTSGVETKKWFDLFAKLINEQGGWKIGADTYDIDMIIYDSENDAIKGKSYLEKLVLQDGVKFILGSPTGNPATDAEVTEPNKVICLGMDALNNSADPEIQYYWTPNGMFFGRGYSYNLYTDVAATGVKSYVSLKTDDMLGHFTDGWGNTTWAVAAPDVKYLETVFYDPSTVDFGPVATKIMSLNPDVVDCAFAIAGGAGVYNALYDAGYKGTFLPVLDIDILNSIVTHCGKEYVEGWESGLSDPKTFQTDPGMLALIDAYTEEYGTWQSDGCVWIAPWFVLKDAIDNAQSVDVEVIKAYLDNQPHPARTLTGYCQLFARPEKDNLRTVSGESAEFIGIVKDGELVPFKATAVKDHYLATILCYDLLDVYKAYWEEYGYPEFPADQTSVLKFSDLGITGQD